MNYTHTHTYTYTHTHKPLDRGAGCFFLESNITQHAPAQAHTLDPFNFPSKLGSKARQKNELFNFGEDTK